MPEIIDLSQEIFSGMPVFPGLPEVAITVHVSHEEWDGITDSDVVTPAVNRLELGEHTGTHVDAINHMARQYRGQSIDTMPLTMFYTEGLCLDLSQKGFQELIEVVDLERALSVAGLEIRRGDTVLLYTHHYRRAFGTADWHRGPGISVGGARWLGERGIAVFGVETASPGVIGVSNKEVHHVCWELGFTHYENMVNLYKLVGRGRFRFIGLPLKIRGGTGSPVRAVAVIEEWGSLRRVQPLSRRGQIRIAARLRQAEAGNLGDWAPVGAEVSEMRVHFGPGYCLYFTRRGGVLIVMLAGGDKSSQQRDIRRAQRIAKELGEDV